MLISYIMNGYCERNEDIIPREVPFEREKIIESVINIFQYITNEHKIVIVLDRLQRAHESTIELLYGMMKNKELFDIVIIASYNEAEDLYSYSKIAGICCQDILRTWKCQWIIMMMIIRMLWQMMYLFR